MTLDMRFLCLLHETSSYIYLNHLNYTKDVLWQSILICTMSTCLYIGIYVRFDFYGLSDPKLLVDSTTFDIIYRVGNFNASKQIF